VDFADTAVRLAVRDDDAPVREVEVTQAQAGRLLRAQSGERKRGDGRAAPAPATGSLSRQPDRRRLGSTDARGDPLPRKPLDLSQMRTVSASSSVSGLDRWSIARAASSTSSSSSASK
jgi:hypothetical protein